MPGKPSQVIVLGSQRSGTTQLFNMLKHVLNYSGDVESHVWPAVAAAWRELDAAVKRMGGEESPAFKYFTVGRVGPAVIKSEFARVVIDVYEKRFGHCWVDKTPGPEMIAAVPVIASALPDAKFIFLRRRGIENVMSQGRRFPNRPLKMACVEWAESMRTWAIHRDKLGQRAIEIDQMRMAFEPLEVAHELAELLGFDHAQEQAVASYLGETRSEQTSIQSSNRTMSLQETGWPVEQQRTFIDLCSPMMTLYGYSFDPEDHTDALKPPILPLAFVSSDSVEIRSSSKKSHFWWEGLTLTCGADGAAEDVSVGNVIASGQNTLEAVLKCPSSPGGQRATLKLQITSASGTQKTEIEVSSGAEQVLAWEIEPLLGPISAGLVATAVGGGVSLSILRPRLSYHNRSMATA